MKRLLLAACIAARALCAGEAFASGEERAIRIVSVAPATTEILFALGSGSELVGVSQFCNYPQEARNIEKVGTFSQPDIEKIISLRPDIVFCTGLEQAPAITTFRQLGLKVYVSDPKNFEDLYNSIIEISSLIGKTENGKALVDKMKREIDRIGRIAESNIGSSRPRVFIEFWHAPIMTAGRGSFIDEMIERAGGVNIAKDSKKPYTYYSQEQVFYHDPEYIILAYMQGGADPYDLISKRYGWSGLSAVRNRHVYNDIDPDILLRAGPRLVDGLRSIQERLAR